MGTISKSRATERANVACKLLDLLAPQVGLEPTTLRLTAGCSTIELLRSNGVSRTILRGRSAVSATT